MSHNDSIRFLLNIQDQNIFFGDFLVEDKYIKGYNAKVLQASLTNSSEYCNAAKLLIIILSLNMVLKLLWLKYLICNFNAF